MTQALLAADTAARTTALTALDRTLLVEAGAGSGKTSVLAGRVAGLLAAGREPAEIAAITFTELAAGELRERVSAFVTELSDGHVRPDLRAAFPTGPSPAQRDHLAHARDRLDELTCTTIHGFCQRLLRPYPAEAGMDPGASVMDRAEAEALFADILDTWLRERLSADRVPDDMLATLMLDSPHAAESLVRAIAEHMLKHRGAQVPEVERLDDALFDLRTNVVAFRAFLKSAPGLEPETVVIVNELEALLATGPGSAHEAEHLLHLLHLPPPTSRSTAKGEFKSYQFKGKWETAFKGLASKAEANAAFTVARDCHDACRDAHDAVRSYAAGRVLRRLATDLQSVLDRFAAAKRGAGLIDFDDLLLKARDLLAASPPVRDALSQRFTAILVDEFQDTDRLQCEILWRLCAARPDASRPWADWPLRPGSLFLVGDPKQAIYRFRGADVASYLEARKRLTTADVDAKVVIAQNFRSLGAILDWVNSQFEPLLSPQPGFQHLFTTAPHPPGHTALATLPVPATGSTDANTLRDAEADAVAAFCRRIVGSLQVRDHSGPRICRPDDIALLAPSGTELWRYERALEQVGIAVSTQAGKGFYRRQEVQDLIALTRVLADSADTLALGALLRGPLVGLTEEELLDATGALPPIEERYATLRLWTPIADVSHPLLRETLAILQGLAQLANRTTPFILLSQAAEELQIRALLRQRQDRTAERALANLDQFLEASRAYDLAGLHAFAAAMRVQWAEGQREMEGRPDTEQLSVSIVTMHSAKGLEWPVVIPINLTTKQTDRTMAVLDEAGRLHLPVFGRHAPGSAAAFAAEAQAADQERLRLWYVAATRARDLLLLPRHDSDLSDSTFIRKVRLTLDAIPPFDINAFEGMPHRYDEQPNSQDRERFDTEAALIQSRTHRLRRVTPHLAEAGETIVTLLPADPDDASAEALPVRGSQTRGRVLHKLMEEVLTGEVPSTQSALEARALVLRDQLSALPGFTGFDADEAATCVLRTLALPAVAALMPGLVPEVTVGSSHLGAQDETVTLGVADALVFDPEGGVAAVLDWKSDVAPTPATVARYQGQVGAYLGATGCSRGLIVFMTSGKIVEVVA